MVLNSASTVSCSEAGAEGAGFLPALQKKGRKICSSLTKINGLFNDEKDVFAWHAMGWNLCVYCREYPCFNI